MVEVLFFLSFFIFIHFSPFNMPFIPPHSLNKHYHTLLELLQIAVSQWEV